MNFICTFAPAAAASPRQFFIPFLLLLLTFITSTSSYTSLSSSSSSASSKPLPSWPRLRFSKLAGGGGSGSGGLAPDNLGILPPNYYKNVAPTVDGQPVMVFVSVIVLNMKLSSTASQTLDMDIFYHNFWQDQRLLAPNEGVSSNGSNVSGSLYKLDHKWADRLWTPNTYFRNAEAGSVSNILSPTHYYSVLNNSHVFMAVRLNLKLSCQMDFRKFPFDVQRCFLNITMTNEDYRIVQLRWFEFRIGRHLDSTEFKIVYTSYENCIKVYEDIGSYSCLFGEVVFKRNIGSYIIKRFVPSFIIVVMTFIGFWIPTSISPARVSIAVTALLALVTQQIQSDLNVSYIYSLQIWNATAIFYVFANLCQYALALFVFHMAQKSKRKVKQSFRRMTSRVSTKSGAAVAGEAEHGSTAIELPTISEEGGGKGDNHCGLSGNHHQVPRARQRTVPVLLNAAKLQLRRRCRALRTRVQLHFRSTTRHSSVDYISRYLFPISYLLFVFAFAAHSASSRTKGAFFFC